MPKSHDRSGRSGLFGFGLGALSFGAVASAIAGTHKILETGVQLRHLWEVGDDNMVFVRIMERVRLDLREVERLLAEPAVKAAVKRMPAAKLKWIEEVVRSVRVALEKTAKFTLRVKRDTDRGVWVGLRNRIWFRMEEYEKLELHTLEIARCHDGLLQVLGLLSGLEAAAVARGSSSRHGFEEIDVDVRERDHGRRHHESIGFGHTLRDHGRKEIDYRFRGEEYDEGDIVYTKMGDGPGFSAEIALDRFDGEQLEAQFADNRRISREEQDLSRSGEHVTEVEVDRTVEHDDGERVASHYVEKHADEHGHRGARHERHVSRRRSHEREEEGGGDDRHIDVRKRAEVRRHHGEERVTKVEIDGVEERDDGHRVEAHFREEREVEDDGWSRGGRRHARHGEEERYIDVERRAEVRRRS